MSIDEPARIRDRDWRLQAITVTTSDFRSPNTGEVVPAGAPVEVAAFMRQGRELLGIRVPSPSALFLSAAAKMARRVERYRRDHLPAGLELMTTPARTKMSRVSIAAETAFFDCIEDILGCVVFSFSAVEAFANETVPDEYRHEALRSDKRCTEIYDRAQIERNLSLDAKLELVLPKIRMVGSPKGGKLWPRYLALKNLRDRIIHLKSVDVRASLPDEVDKALWSHLWDPTATKSPVIARELIQHYFPNADGPRWLRKISL